MILKSISEGIKFAFSLNVIIPYIVLYLITFYVMIGLFSTLLNFMPLGTGGFRALLSLGIYLPFFIIIGLAYLWVHGAIIDQAKYYPRRKPLAKSFEYSTSRYLTMLCAAILFGVIMVIISSPPYIGPLLSFVLGLMLFYLYPAIIVDKKRCIESFKKSFNTFMKYPLETFVTSLLTIVLSLIIVGIFALPLIIFVFANLTGMPNLPTAAGVEQQTMLKSLLPGISNAVHSPYFIIYLFIFCVGLAINSSFEMGTRTRLYINTRRAEA